MADFWSLPYPYKMEAPDADVPRLEAMADKECRAGWELEYDGDLLHFRFASDEERGVFILHSYVGKY